jgi:O-antigen ligase
MNLQERRALRVIEKNLTVEDPVLAELLRLSEGPPQGRTRWFAREWIRRLAGWLAVAFLLLGLGLGDAALLLTAVLLAGGAVLGWIVRAVRTRGSRR